MLATVLEANSSKNIFGLEITVRKEMKSTSTKKKFLRVIVFNKNINSICDWTHSGRQCSRPTREPLLSVCAGHFCSTISSRRKNFTISDMHKSPSKSIYFTGLNSLFCNIN